MNTFFSCQRQSGSFGYIFVSALKRQQRKRGSWGARLRAAHPPAPWGPSPGAGNQSPLLPHSTRSASPGSRGWGGGGKGCLPRAGSPGPYNLGRNCFMFVFRIRSKNCILSKCMPIIVRLPFKVFQAFKDYSKHLKWASI